MGFLDAVLIPATGVTKRSVHLPLLLLGLPLVWVGCRQLQHYLTKFLFLYISFKRARRQYTSCFKNYLCL